MIDQDEMKQSMNSVPPPVPSDDQLGNTGNLIAELLKNPVRVARTIAAEPEGLLNASFGLLAVALVCHAIFGGAIGLFAGWHVALLDVAKAPLVALCSLLLCFPSLYVFSCVAGSPLTLLQTFALGCSCQAMVGLLLIGLAPVGWLFAVSTASLPFIVMLAFAVWFVAIVFADRYVEKLKAVPLFSNQAGIKTWFVILVIVSLQMTTCMRPLLGTSGKGILAGEKMFFLAHFVSVFDASAK